MTKERYKLDQWEACRIRAMGRCEVCGKPVQGGEFGHRIGQGKHKSRYFSFWFLYHALNGLWCCSTVLGFMCNGKADIGNSLDGREEHIQAVIRAMDEHPDIPPHSFRDYLTYKEYHVKGGGDV